MAILSKSYLSVSPQQQNQTNTPHNFFAIKKYLKHFSTLTNFNLRKCLSFYDLGIECRYKRGNIKTVWACTI